MADIDDLKSALDANSDKLAAIRDLLQATLGQSGESKQSKSPVALPQQGDSLLSMVGRQLSKVAPQLSEAAKSIGRVFHTTHAVTGALLGQPAKHQAERPKKDKDDDDKNRQSLLHRLVRVIGETMQDAAEHRGGKSFPQMFGKLAQANFADPKQHPFARFLSKFKSKPPELPGVAGAARAGAAEAAEGVAGGAAAGAEGGGLLAGAAAALANPVGLVVAGVAAVAAAFLIVPPLFKKLGESVLNLQRDLAKGSGKIAAIFAVLDAQELQRQGRIGNATARSTGILANQVNGLRTNLEPMTIFFTNIRNLFAAALVSLGSWLSSKLAPLFKTLNETLEELMKKLGVPNAPNTPGERFMLDVAAGKLKAPRRKPIGAP